MRIISSQSGLIPPDIYKPIDEQSFICSYSYDATDSITISVDVYIKGNRVYKRNNSVKTISLLDIQGIDSLINMIKRVRKVNIDKINPEYESILKSITRDMIISKIID